MAPEDNAPAAGQDDEQTDTTESRTASTPEDSTEETDWKALARKWEREAKKGTSALTKAEQELVRLREANQSEAEKALEAARREGQKAAEQEWKTKWQAERLRGEALRAMNGRVVDPRLAFPHLDLDGLMDDEGSVDSKALSKAIDALLDEYPALAAGGDAPAHHLDLGPKRTSKAPSQDMNTLLRQAAGRQ